MILRRRSRADRADGAHGARYKATSTATVYIGVHGIGAGKKEHFSNHEPIKIDNIGDIGLSIDKISSPTLGELCDLV
jgi:hypothetical protein